MRSRLLVMLLSLLALTAFGMGPCAVDDFDLGVGAFEVGQDRAILWTHVVPEDPSRSTALVRVDVATDAGFTQIVHSKTVVAFETHDFTTRALITGLQPGTQYHYRFFSVASEVVSPMGSFHTAPTQNDAGPVRFVLSGDSNLGYTGPGDSTFTC